MRALRAQLANDPLAADGLLALGLTALSIATLLAGVGLYGVLSLPTVILFAGGELKATVYGAQPRARFEREFAPHL